ncbi:MAG: metallophosphoesterase, partial [Phycisphaerales bacterium]|nr:metallophosphoesterase [Phycisphaerales bacterium]
PDLIINGGDQIMDALGEDRTRTRTQFDLWTRVIGESVATPMINVIGNHDVWGWDRDESKTTGNEDLYGKRWALDVFGLRERFFSLDRNGWHLVVLDSTHPVTTDGRPYTARLDDAQFEWLEGDLANTPATTPVMVVSHIPILAACTFLDGDNEERGDWNVPGAWMHIDARRIKDLFFRHPNVKLCISGHVHLADVVEYLGVTYVCNHAVSGGWWKGPRDEFAPAFGIVDLYDDGSFETMLVNTGWEARGS